MPTYYARSAGNVNGAIWATTPTGTAGSVTFDPSDVLVLNSFSIQGNVSFTVAEVRNDNTGGATAGGFITPSNGVTITANITNVGSTTNGIIQTTANPTFTIVGNLTCGTAHVVRIMGTGGGNITIVGNLTGGNGSGAAFFIDSISGCTVNITGNATGGSTSNSHAILLSAAGNTVNITGNVTGGSAGNGVNISATTTLNITGTVTGAGAAGVQGTNNYLVNIIGTCAGGVAAGASAFSTGTMNITRARGGPLTNSAVGVSNGTTGSVVNVDEIEYGDAGMTPTSGPIRLADKTSNVAVMFRFGTTKKVLVDTASTSLVPAASNVRSGVTYNAGQSTGTCAVPGAASVLVGVAVDNTVGTAAVSSAAIQSACDSALTAFSSGRLGNVATVASTGQQIANAFGQ